MALDPTFEVTVPTDRRPGETLVLGLANFGMAGLTAVDYLVRHLDSEPVGAVVPHGLPAIAPFEDGRPRHPTRLYDVAETSLCVLVGELFVPPAIAQPFAGALLDWARSADIEEVVVLHGVPYPHGEQEHAVFHVATDAYRDARLDDAELAPLAGGVLDGPPGELVIRNLDDGLPVGVFVTPTHPPGPDVDASIKLLDALESLYAFEVDETELRQLGEEMRQYYAQLGDRMAKLAEGEKSVSSHDYPEDRMYM